MSAPSAPRRTAAFDLQVQARARALGAATVHEGAYRQGALPSAIKPLRPDWKVAGPAYPVATTPAINVWIHDAIYRAPGGSVLVVHCGGYYEAGYWGDLMSNAAVAVGLAGLVIDGCVRDADDLCELGFPVFARGLSIQGTTKERMPLGQSGQPVHIGAVLVQAGDLVVGDRDGVLVVPDQGVAAAMARAEERAVKEAQVRERLRAGERTGDILGFPLQTD